MWKHFEFPSFELWKATRDGVSLAVVRDLLDRDGTYTASVKRADGRVQTLSERFASLDAAQMAVVAAARSN